jgi:GlpG protein
MRHLTTISGKAVAESFVAYLLTQDISTHVEQVANDPSQWDVWIRDEDKNEIAREEYRKFQLAPEDPKYRQAIDHAKSILKEQKQKSVERVKNVRQPTPRLSPSLFGGPLPPLTMTVIVLCVFLGLVTQFGEGPDPNNWLGNLATKQLKFVDLKAYKETKDPAASIKKGEVWRIVTPAFLHGSTLHLLLNMLSLASLGRIVERLEGTGRYAIILLLTATGSHLLQGLMPLDMFGSPNFVGISGVIMGLVGYVGIKTMLRPDLGFSLSPQVYVMTALILVLGFGGGDSVKFPLANLAHLGGLIAGCAIGFVMSDRRFDR